jgi:LysM repeat protein
MTERSVPIVGGASVCPFVAFEDRRDERASRPDHRHRCFAEVRPATRALAHQDAYCLSPAFPACPTFQDWARREAARARASAPSVRAPEPIDEPVARIPQRDWSAPPPWIDESAGPSRATVTEGAGLAESAGARLAESEGAGLAESAGARLAESAGAGLADAPSFLAERDRPPTSAIPPSSGVRPTSGAGRPAAGAGLAASAGAATVGAASAGAGVGVGDEDWPDDEADDEAEGYRADSSSGRVGRSRPPSGRRPSVSDSRRGTRSLGGPSWERPQRDEAYPTLRTRVGLPSIPRVAVAFAGLIAAALLLFFIPPMFIRPGGEADTSGGATPSPSAEPSASLAPTPIPAPTPQVYVIAAGDTLSKVAKSYGLSLEELLAANPSIKNPDKIAIGDEIVIPAAVPSEVVDAGGASGSAAPSVAP